MTSEAIELVLQLRAEVERLTRDRDSFKALALANAEAIARHCEETRVAQQQLAASQARITELEQVLRLNLAVSHEDPILVEPVEQQLVASQVRVQELESKYVHQNVLFDEQEHRQVAEQEHDRLRTALDEIFRYLRGLDQNAFIRPQRHLDLWPWDGAQQALRGAGEAQPAFQPALDAMQALNAETAKAVREEGEARDDSGATAQNP